MSRLLLVTEPVLQSELERSRRLRKLPVLVRVQDEREELDVRTEALNQLTGRRPAAAELQRTASVSVGADPDFIRLCSGDRIEMNVAAGAVVFAVGIRNFRHLRR